MKINRNNYEAYFIDYYEGTLTTAQQQALELFLSENPDLQEEFENYEEVSVAASGVAFPDKSQLKQQEITPVAGIDEENYEEYFIAFYENDLDEEKQKSLQLFLQANPHIQKEFGLHGTLVLTPDNTPYAGKSGLKKKAIVGYYWYAAAAVILLLLAINFLTRQNTSVPRQQQMEIAQLDAIKFSGVLASLPSAEPLFATVEVRDVTLPEPDSFEKTNIPFMASARMDNIAPEPDYDAIFEEITFNYPVALVKNTGMPKQKSLLAKIFNKNLSKVKDGVGIDVNRVKKENNDPGFVRFLDGSLIVFNTITGSDTELVKNYDKNGNLRDYRLEGETLLVSRKVPSGGTK
jgi:hypothetical protein